MNTFAENYDSPWALHRREASKRKSAKSLHHNQWRPDDSQCAIRVRGQLISQRFDLACPKPARVRLEFEIGGGTDCPYFGLTLKVRGDNPGPRNEQEVVMSVRYYSWAPARPGRNGGQDHTGDRDARFRVPIKLGEPAPTDTVSFSRRLYDVRFEASHPVPSDMSQFEELEWASLPSTMMFCWSAVEPVCLGFDQSVDGFPADCIDAVEIFRWLAWPEYTVQAYLRGQGGIIGGWKHFCAQPSPTLPTWWRYAHNPIQGPTVKYLEPLDDLRMYHGLRDDLVRYPGALDIVSMTSKVSFADEREFEAHIKGGAIREHEYQRQAEATAYNKIWKCKIVPVTSLDRSGNPDAHMVWVDISSFVLENGVELEPPHEGVTVTLDIQLHSDETAETWNGKVVESSGQSVVVYALRPPGGRGFVISPTYEVEISFGHLGGPLVRMKKAVSWLMYGEVNRGIPADSWLKRVVLGHSTVGALARPAEGLRSRTKLNAATIVGDVSRELDLNTAQTQAVRSFLSEEGGIRLVAGPPGTGKTMVIVAAVIGAMRMGVKTLVCAGSNAAVNVISQKLYGVLRKEGMDVRDVYRVGRKITEAFPGEGQGGGVEDDDEEMGGATAVVPFEEPDDETNMNPHLMRDLKLVMERMEDSKPILSLSERILQAMSQQRRGLLFGSSTSSQQSSLDRDQMRIISELNSVVNAPLMHEDDGGLNRKVRNRQLEEKWNNAQRHFLGRAQVILSTCANTWSRIMGDFHPNICIVDEAGQVSEPECLVPLVTYLGSLRNIGMVGDIKQLPPTVTSIDHNEFADQLSTSLFARLLKNGVTPITLKRQYRMHPDICRFPNKNFYEETLVTDGSVMARRSGSLFCNWVNHYTKRQKSEPAPRCVFMNVQDGELEQERGGTSKVNLANACVVFRLVSSMVNDGGIPAADILVMSYYLAQTRLLRQLLRGFFSVVRVRTVDASQGGESSVVVLDSVTPGGPEFPIGFVRDPNRLNVGLTRARDGLLVVGSADMASSGHKTKGKSLWARLIADMSHSSWDIRGHPGDSTLLSDSIRARYGPITARRVPAPGNAPPPPPPPPCMDEDGMEVDHPIPTRPSNGAFGERSLVAAGITGRRTAISGERASSPSYRIAEIDDGDETKGSEEMDSQEVEDTVGWGGLEFRKTGGQGVEKMDVRKIEEMEGWGYPEVQEMMDDQEVEDTVVGWGGQEVEEIDYTGEECDVVEGKDERFWD